MMKIIRTILYIEIVVNIANIVMSFFAPASLLAQFAPEPYPPLAMEMTRWFAVLLFVITYIMWRALRSDNAQALRWVIEGYLMGDILYLVALVSLATTVGAWTFGGGVAVVFTLVFGGARIAYLWLTRLS